MIRRLFLLQTLLIFTVYQSEAKLTIECIVDYLKEKNFETNYFSSVSAYNGNDFECTKEINAQNDIFISQFRNRFSGPSKYIDCVVNELKAEGQFEKYNLAAFGAELMGVGWKFWKSNDKTKYIQNNFRMAEESEKTALKNCEERKKYGEIFDSYYEEKKAEQFPADYEFCLRKYIAENNILQHNQYGFSVNMIQAAGSETTDCHSTMAYKISYIMVDGIKLNDDTRYVGAEYYDEFVKLEMLSKLTMTSSEKEAEKEKFVKKMISLRD